MARINVRARTVDMLGRQQIAGIPTAIHELFKNAHDAYARHAEVDFFRSDSLFLLRDDGQGMTKDEFENRWLTLGTESKVGANSTPHPPPFGEQNARPIMGEKGIGRLAIASIGPQVLVLTRAYSSHARCPLVASLIHWGLFEIPGLNLDEIEVPVIELDGQIMPSKANVQTLIDAVRANLTVLGARVPTAVSQQIDKDLDLYSVDLQAIYASLRGLTLTNDGHGTHFLIRPVNEILTADIGSNEDDTASPLEKVLLGFSNTMVPSVHPVTLNTEFRDHHEDGTTEELISGDSFFTPEEFASADHHIVGAFDAYGQFNGTLSLYRKAPIEHTVRWPDARGHATSCGPFRIRFAYVQGDLEHSLLPPDIWAELSAKLNKIGGLYVYRDGIRVLPYGNSDFDFLNIERRRTKSAQDWFFSYRRIFGAVEITSVQNPNLVEKAGREGFRTNRAYREFVSILENFFRRIAIDFFRPTSQFGDEFNSTKAELIREAELLKKRQKSTLAKRKEFASGLERFFSNLETGSVAKHAEQVREDLSSRLSTISRLGTPEQMETALIKLNLDLHAAVSRINDSVTIASPRNLSLSKSLRSDWNAYLRNNTKLREEVLDPLEAEVDAAVASFSTARGLSFDRRKLTTERLEGAQRSVLSQFNKARRELHQNTSSLQAITEERTREASKSLASAIEQIFVELTVSDLEGMSDVRFREQQQAWEAQVVAAGHKLGEKLAEINEQLVAAAAGIRSEESQEATVTALENTVDAYRDQLTVYSELAQMGMAVGVIQHEFANTVKRIRGAIRRLAPWAAGTPELQSVYNDIRLGFDHLDSYLKLFTPLSRRTNRQKILVSGEEIRRYVSDVFGDRLLRHSIQLRATPRFDVFRITTYPSVLLASVVNIVDNAIYWLSTIAEGEKMIRLDADADGISISNTGPGIDDRVADRIFDFGESTKIGGRGIGLYIAREALRREGLDIVLRSVGKDSQPDFHILVSRTPTV